MFKSGGEGRHGTGGRARVRAGSAAVAVVCLLGAAGCTTRGHAAGASPHTATSSAASAGTPAARSSTRAEGGSPRPSDGTAASGWGVTASWVEQENAKTGTSAWRIGAQSGAPIGGYADATQAVAGQRVRLFVSTTAPTFTAQAFRMGYYGGEQARLVWTSPATPGGQQPRCPLTPGVNMVSCSWRPSLAFTVAAGWPPGDYLLRLQAAGGQASYVPLTVADPASDATYLVQNDVLTWQAWNAYGGYDMYGGGPPGRTPTYAGRARVLSYDRPYLYGNGAADFLGNELPLVSFMEQHGLDVTYVTDVYLNEHPAAMLGHKAFLSLGHDECWAMAQRDGVIQAIKHGVNAVFFGASPILRHVRLQPSPLGPDREMVDYRDPTQDPIFRRDPRDATGNTWAQPPADDPASVITGNTYGGYGIDAAMVVSDAASWPFAGTGLRDGAALPHVVRSDYDHVVPRQPGPADVQVLTRSPVTTPYGVHSTANMTYYTDPSSQAGVIATGTNAWIASLASCPPGTAPCPAAAVQRITGNILRVFGNGPAGATNPSQP